MFSGIVETIGFIVSITNENGCKHFCVKPASSFTDLIIGESIAINGVCLTVTDFTNDHFNITAVPETLRLTNLNDVVVGDIINMERAMRADSRIGGHYVQGHVDDVGHILEIGNDNSDTWLVKISIPKRLSKYIVNKGYITLDGMSITVIETGSDWFTVTFIPHTQEVTLVNQYRIGRAINIEVDIMAKYIEKMLGAYAHAIPN